MQKKLLPLAIAAAIAAPAANADVTIYGKMHVSLDYISADNVGDVDRNGDGDFNDPGERNDASDLQVSSNSSRIGFKGSEDLGGGLKAIWQVEQEVRLDEDGGGWAGRNSFLGLSGGWGTFLAGKHDTPFKIVGRKLDLFGDTAADTRGIIGGNGAAAAHFNQRTNNTIAYVSPDFSGFTGIVAYVTDHQIDRGIRNNAFGFERMADITVDDNAYDAWSLSGTYSNGPLFLAAAYEQHNGDDDNVDNRDDVDEDAWRLGGYYKFGAFKVGGMYERVNNDVADQVVALGAFAGNVEAEQDTWGLFGSYDFGNNTVKAHYYMTEAELSGAGVPAGYPDFEATHWAIGLDHKFSQRTKAYVLYVSADDDGETFGGAPQGVSLTGIGGGHGDDVGAADGEDASSFSVGLVHSF
jgi:predicted porin